MEITAALCHRYYLKRAMCRELFKLFIHEVVQVYAPIIVKPLPPQYREGGDIVGI